ncbi:Fms-interacting protein-domain-containing protein [Spinellus fusiger]|nr:Fms-interacting protein-domain-containing protein [Spinellus fusiger]
MSALDISPLRSIIEASEELQSFIVDQLKCRITGTLSEDVLEGEKGLVLLKTIDKIMDLHTRAFGSTRISKQSTAEAKTAMDERQIGLQNVMYEKRHLLEEIVKCRDFRSVYQNVDLISLEEFDRTAPSHYKESYNPHALMINRLKFEHEARLNLKEQQEKLQAERIKLIKENRKAQEKLDRFDKLYDDLVQASIPMELALVEQDKGTDEVNPVHTEQPEDHTMGLDSTERSLSEYNTSTFESMDTE